MRDFCSSRPGCRIGLGQLVQECHISRMQTESEVMGRGSGEREPKRRGRLIHHGEPESSRETGRSPSDRGWSGRETHSLGGI